MSKINTCQFCNKNDGPIICTNPDCGINFCMPCAKLIMEKDKSKFTRNGKITIICPKCGKLVQNNTKY